jgi:hypothetical protein
VYASGVPKDGIFYRGRAEIGAVNLRDKISRKKNDEFFEWPEMIATNKAIVELLGTEDIQNLLPYVETNLQAAEFTLT